MFIDGITKRICFLFPAIAAIIVFSFPANAGINELTKQEEKSGFELLFNGEDLTGWTPTANPKAFSVEDGCIILTPNKGHYLRSEKKYENFILRLEYKLAPKTNSGIFFHAPEHGRLSRIGGEIQIFDSHGQEPKTWHAGALYGVYPPKVDASKPAGEWNELELYCNWPHLKVTLNGTVVQDVNCEDDIRLRWRNRCGYLGIQDHGGKAWFRTIRVKDLGGNSESRWTSLFNGEDLSGWNIIGEAKWSVENGELVARDGNGYAITEKEYKDFHLWAYVNASENSNGGIFYRWNKLGDRGYEAQIYNVKGAKNMTGSIYNHTPAETLLSKNGQWFLMQIVCKGNYSLVLVNGKPIAEYHETEDRPGHISLQMHSRNSHIRFKDLRIETFD